ncbi:MAG: hypothetical protein NT149_01425 [Candidatus Gottesmanbacteria bacterium]|nr:hypothetical protein [Candidatus Gottesmanbacteria bacterium]
MGTPEIPKINSGDVSIADYRQFAPEQLRTVDAWERFVLLIADIHRDGLTSTHVVGRLLSPYETNDEILEHARGISRQLACSNMRIFLAGLGTAAEIGALNTGVQFLNLKDGSTMETVPPRQGASLDVLVEDEEIKQQLRSVMLDTNRPRINVR